MIWIRRLKGVGSESLVIPRIKDGYSYAGAYLSLAYAGQRKPVLFILGTLTIMTGYIIFIQIHISSSIKF